MLDIPYNQGTMFTPDKGGNCLYSRLLVMKSCFMIILLYIALMNEPWLHVIQPIKASHSVNGSIQPTTAGCWAVRGRSEAEGWEMTGRKRWQGWRGCVTTGGNPVCLPKWYFNLRCGPQLRFFSGSFQRRLAFFTSWNWARDVNTTLTLARGQRLGKWRDS